MKLWSVTTTPASRSIPCLASIGLVLLAAMSASPGAAEDAPKPSATTTVKSESSVIKPAKLAQSVKSEDKASKTAPASKPKAKPASFLTTAECVRTGQRVIAALARDDSGAASQFHTFYTAFKCSQQHLALAFGCLVNLQKANPGLSNPSSEQVTQCWDEPSEIPTVSTQPGTDGSGEKH